MTTPKVGTLALDTLKSLAVAVHGPAGSPDSAAALADLRALMAQAEAYRSERDRLRAALDVFVRRSARVSQSSDPLYCIYESDVTEAEIIEARAALAECGSASAADPDDDTPVCEVSGCGKPCATHKGYVLEMCADHERECGGGK